MCKSNLNKMLEVWQTPLRKWAPPPPLPLEDSSDLLALDSRYIADPAVRCLCQRATCQSNKAISDLIKKNNLSLLS